jgi:hypothetical protein
MVILKSERMGEGLRGNESFLRSYSIRIRLRAFTAASLKGVCFLSFRKKFKKVTKTPP